jgi:hypothetical protein
MTPSLRRAAWAGLLLFIAWAVFKSYAFYRVHFPIRDHAMISPLQEMQTFCVGRYLIDLPKGSVLFRAESSAGSDADVDFFADYPVPRHEFTEKTLKRWEELKELKKDGNEVFEKPSERIEIMPDGVVFTFRHRADYEDEWPSGAKGWLHFYETEGYLWRNNVHYRFSGGRVKKEIEIAMQRLVLRQDDEIPSRQGFCGGRSFFPGSPQERESVEFAFHLPTTPLIDFRIGTTTGGTPPKPNLSLLNSDSFKASRLRDANRTIGDLGGEEWINTSTNKRYDDHFISQMYARWYHPEGVNMAKNPDIDIRMEINIHATTPPPTFGELPPAKAEGEVGKEEFLALWDGILKTLRPRPGAF